MAEENEYRVTLVYREPRGVDLGSWVYRGERLPDEDDIIEVVLTLSRSPIPSPPPRVRARVTRVDADRDPPIITATQIDEALT